MPNRNLILSLIALLAVQLGVWQWSLSYEHFLTLSGFLAINFMSITMLLAMRPKWLEVPLGGLDKQYHLHKWPAQVDRHFGRRFCPDTLADRDGR